MDFLSNLFQEVQEQRREIASIRMDAALHRERTLVAFSKLRREIVLLKEATERPRQIALTDLLKSMWFKAGIALGATGAIWGAKVPEELGKDFVGLLKLLLTST